MTKSEFLAFLDGVMATFEDAPNDPFRLIMERIIEKAQSVEPETITVPQTPIEPWKPWNPGIWYTSNNIELDNYEEMEYNGIKIKKDPTLPDPNDWSMENNTPGRPDFTVVE